MAKVVKHGWTHRPRSEGGTDPIEIPSAPFNTPWATATMFETSVTKVSAYYRAKFVTCGTNEPTMFELSGISGAEANYLAINEYGYYIAYALVSTGVELWGANYTNLEMIWNDGGGDSTFGTGGDAYSDFIWGSNRISEQFANEAQSSSPDHHTLATWAAFHYAASGTQSNWEGVSPLEIGVRCQSDKTDPIDLFAQVHVRRIADPGYTLTDLAA